MDYNESIGPRPQETELCTEIVQLEQYARHSLRQAGYFLQVFLKNFRLSFSYLHTSLTALLSCLVSYPKIVFLQVKGYLVC